MYIQYSSIYIHVHNCAYTMYSGGWKPITLWTVHPAPNSSVEGMERNRRFVLCWRVLLWGWRRQNVRRCGAAGFPAVRRRSADWDWSDFFWVKMLIVLKKVNNGRGYELCVPWLFGVFLPAHVYFVQYKVDLLHEISTWCWWSMFVPRVGKLFNLYICLFFGCLKLALEFSLWPQHRHG